GLLRRHQRLLQNALAILEAARPLLERLELFFEQRILFEQRLVVSGHVLEKGVDLLHVEAAEHPDRELLLANVHGRDPHGNLLLSTSTGAKSAGSPAPRTGWQ